MYSVDIEHKELGKFRRIKGADPYVVEQKAKAQQHAWNELWQRKCALKEAQTKRQQLAIYKEEKKTAAAELTAEAQKEVEALKNILPQSDVRRGKRYWDSFYDRSAFREPKPQPPKLNPCPPEPSLLDPDYHPRVGLLSSLFPSVQRRREQEADQRLLCARSKWQAEAKEIIRANTYSKASYAHAVNLWEAKRVKYENARTAANNSVDTLRAKYACGDADAVEEYTDIVLSASDYPECFPKQWKIDFISETGVMVIDYDLPSLDDLPKLKSVKYIQSRDVTENVHFKDTELSSIYDHAMYQTALRTLGEVFNSDELGLVRLITFNGWVEFIDKTNGQKARSCIMSVQVTAEDIKGINFSAVDPKVCFRSLKGVGSAKLSGMASVVPILQLDRNDERFVDPHNVVSGITETTNIAAIPWEEFEYLVRDIFEKEFSSHGGEVKITRASRDHGIDAVAFDPDPIRGGKIVIQAKRYTNVVGVSAVRDLYGTLINEGANRGILVTTSQYGPDSYAFAKDKPITLLDGGNLLSLLDRHGHKARIDLDEAKRLGTLREIN